MPRAPVLVVIVLALLAVTGLGWWLIAHDPQPEGETGYGTDDRAANVAAPAPPATAQATPLPPLAGQTFVAGCRQGECGWIEVLRFERVRTVPQGELRRLVIRRGSSLHPDGDLPATPADARIEWAPGEKTDYVFCSTERPAFAFQDDGGALVTHYLDLFDLAGYQYTSAGLVMRACHGGEEVPDAAGLRALGYRPGTRNEQVEGGTPEDLARF